MSRIYVDRISPYQSGSVQVDGLNLDTGSLTTKTEFNTYTSSNDGKVNALIAATSSYQPAGDYATTGSNTFNGTQTLNVGDGVFAFRVNFDNSFLYSVGSSNAFGILKNDFSEATVIGPTFGTNTYGASADVGITHNLNGVSGQGDDRAGLYAYSGSVAQDVITLPKKSWDNNGQVEFKTPVKVSANHFISGEGTQLFNDISNNSQVDNLKVNSWTSPSGHTISLSTIGWQRYDGTVHGWVQELYTGDYAYGSNVIHEPSGWRTQLFASGSAYSGGEIKIQDQGDTTVEITLDADKTNVTNVMKLSQLDPLPAGTVGELAVSGSNLYFHNGTSWSQIN